MKPLALLPALLVCAGIGAGFVPQVLAQPSSDVAQRRADLKEVQQRIRELEESIAQTQATHAEASAGLVEAERAVSESRRRLRTLSRQRSAAESELAEAQAEQQRIEARIEARREELASLLRRHYMHGGSDVAPFLSGGDPNQLARDAHYLEHVGRARLMLIEGLRADQIEQQRLAREAVLKRDRIAALQAEQGREQGTLEKVLARRAALVADLSGQLQGQSRAVEALRENEQQLGRVIELLLQRQSVQRMPASPVAPPVARIDTGPLAQSTPKGTPFRQLRGKLGFPVRGELAGRYGAPRGDGGARWRGLFIRASDGEEVRAVAAGEVVFSDWMRGYGNLIIVDHGDDYLTIYANNDALLRVVGDRVEGGAPIASVGASGGAWESGLYFELRHKGEPVDPLRWLRGG